MRFKSIGIMCGSSEACSDKLKHFAFTLGEHLANNKIRMIYGGGAKGLMNQAANGALSKNGEVYGYIPEFMTQVEWQHKGLTQLIKTKDMDERKTLMMTKSDATIFLPGGSGTMEEFFQWLVCKRLGQYTGPLILFNIDGYYDPLVILLDNMVKEKFHSQKHAQMYHFCETLEQMDEVLRTYEDWPEDAIKFAPVK